MFKVTYKGTNGKLPRPPGGHFLQQSNLFQIFLQRVIDMYIIIYVCTKCCDPQKLKTFLTYLLK